jgi:hypothetical protein
MPAFLATYSDGYKRTIAAPSIKTIEDAYNYARQLESWFGMENRKFASVAPKGR